MPPRMPIVLTGSTRTLVGIRARWFGLITALAISCLFASLSAQPTAEQTTPSMPVHARFEEGAEFRRLNKKVVDSGFWIARKAFRHGGSRAQGDDTHRSSH